MVIDADYGTANNAVSLEMLPDLTADYLLVSTGYEPSSGAKGGAAKKRFAQLYNDPLWQQIPAVKDNHVIEIDPMVWNAHGLIAKERAMKQLNEAWATIVGW